MRTHRNDPQSSFDAEKRSASAAVQHRLLIKNELERKPNQTGRELEKSLKGVLSYQQIMRRVSEVAQRGDLRPCTSGQVRGQVVQWYIGGE